MCDKQERQTNRLTEKHGKITCLLQSSHTIPETDAYMDTPNSAFLNDSVLELQKLINLAYYQTWLYDVVLIQCHQVLCRF